MKKADEIIKAFIPMINSREGADYLDLFSSWSTILGEGLEDIAAHTEPVDIKNGALILYVDHPGWMQRLEFRKRKLLGMLKKKYPELGIHSVFIQKVSSERFLERREARVMGNTPSAGKQSTGSTPKMSEEKIEKSQKPTEEGNSKDSQNHDSRFAETLRRFEELSKKAPKK